MPAAPASGCSGGRLSGQEAIAATSLLITSYNTLNNIHTNLQNHSTSSVSVNLDLLVQIPLELVGILDVIRYRVIVLSTIGENKLGVSHEIVQRLVCVGLELVLHRCQICRMQSISHDGSAEL